MRLALSATVFTLILSFRVARLVSRTAEEDNRTFSLVRSFEALSNRKRDLRGKYPGWYWRLVRRMVRIYWASYEEARGYIVRAIRDSSGQDRERLIALEGELDSLAHSRQQGINFGEGCALLIFAGITVGLMVLSRPAVAGLTGFLVEMLAILFSAVIVFLTVNVFGPTAEPEVEGAGTDEKPRGVTGCYFRIRPGARSSSGSLSWRA